MRSYVVSSMMVLLGAIAYRFFTTATQCGEKDQDAYYSNEFRCDTDMALVFGGIFFVMGALICLFWLLDEAKKP